MATVRLHREVGADEVQRHLEAALGPGYRVRPGGGDSLKVRRSGPLGATVRLTWSSGGTTCKVSGSGLLVVRLFSSTAVVNPVVRALGRLDDAG